MKLVGVGAGAWLVPACGDDAAAPPRGRFFDEAQWAAIDAATEIVLPGAREARAVGYIDRLLAAFDVAPPAIFGGGPFSGRAAPGDDAFAAFLPLSRVRRIAWRARIHGGDDTPIGPVRGYRDVYASAISALDAAAAQIRRGARFVELADGDTALFDADGAVPGFLDLLTAHTIEGMFAAPEYGGNRDLAGWRLARYDGDSAPLGHAIFDEATMTYRDRPDQPTTIASDPPEDFSADVIQTLTIAALGSGGMRFF